MTIPMNKATLRIEKLCHTEASCIDGKEIVLLSEASSEGVKICFYDDEGWESFGERRPDGITSENLSFTMLPMMSKEVEVSKDDQFTQYDNLLEVPLDSDLIQNAPSSSLQDTKIQHSSSLLEDSSPLFGLDTESESDCEIIFKSKTSFKHCVTLWTKKIKTIRRKMRCFGFLNCKLVEPRIVCCRTS